MTKVCPKCGRELLTTLEFWYKNKATKTGLQSYCKDCVKAYGVKERIENPERIKVRQAKWRIKNPEWGKAYSAKWHLENRNKVKICSAKWEKSNPDKAKARHIKWRKKNLAKSKAHCVKWKTENPEKVRANNRRRRARKMQAQGSHTHKQLLEQLARQKGKCYWCNNKMNSR